MPSSDDAVPRGFVFRTHRTSGVRRALVAVVLLAGGALVWPIYPQFSSITPYVLGLPLSLAWVIGWLGVVFVALVVVYRIEEHGDPGFPGGDSS